MEAEGVLTQDFLFFYCICIPLLTSTISAVLKFRDDLSEKMISHEFYFLGGLYAFNQIAFLVCFYLFYTLGNAMTITVGLLFVYYMSGQYYFLKKNDFVEPVFFKWANPILLCSTILVVILFAVFSDSVKGVAAWTICLGLISVILSTVLVLSWLNDRLQRLTRPVAYSPYIFPVY
jgi:hypothetical protein